MILFSGKNFEFGEWLNQVKRFNESLSENEKNLFDKLPITLQIEYFYKYNQFKELEENYKLHLELLPLLAQ